MKTPLFKIFFPSILSQIFQCFIKCNLKQEQIAASEQDKSPGVEVQPIDIVAVTGAGQIQNHNTIARKLTISPAKGTSLANVDQ
jgi:hypothetical protein